MARQRSLEPPSKVRILLLQRRACDSAVECSLDKRKVNGSNPFRPICRFSIFFHSFSVNIMIPYEFMCSLILPNINDFASLSIKLYGSSMNHILCLAKTMSINCIRFD